jgi:hypothetical protein
VHALDEPFVAAISGAQCVTRFGFAAKQTNMCVHECVYMCELMTTR